MHDGCNDYKMAARRSFLRTAGRICAAAAVAGPEWLPSMAFAQDDDPARDVIIQVFLRGGADGLSLCVPYAEDDYYSNRPTIAIPRPDSSSSDKAIDLDGFFGLPPAMSDLKPLYDAGEFAIVHATGFGFVDRSHFRSMNFIELGRTDINSRSGWLGRHLAAVPPAPSRILGLAPHDYIPLALAGAPQTVAVTDIDAFNLQGNWLNPAARSPFLSSVYSNAGADQAIQDFAMAALGTLDIVGPIQAGYAGPANGAVYPNSEFGRGMETIARVVKAEVGLESACVDINDWDHHVAQNPLGGVMFEKMQDLAQGLRAFREDVGTRFSRVTIVVMSEFGRRVAENGSAGTEHGTGGAMLVLGGNVNGGQVITNWPGLYPNQLFEMMDLPITIDSRDILGEILAKRAGNTDLDAIFPGYSVNFRNVVS